MLPLISCCRARYSAASKAKSLASKEKPKRGSSGSLPQPVMAALTQKKSTASVTSRPEGRQQAQPSLGSESIVVPLLAVDRGHRGEYDRIFLPVAHQDCPEHRDHGKGQEPAPGTPVGDQKERTQANCHHEHIKSSEPV